MNRKQLPLVEILSFFTLVSSGITLMMIGNENKEFSYGIGLGGFVLFVSAMLLQKMWGAD